MNNRSAFAAMAAVACTLSGVTATREAHACGGCFHGKPSGSQTVADITDERMLLAVSPNQTTLYDQIRYTGNPSSFAWVLPIHGTVDVGLSADVMFDSVDALTTAKITGPVQNCPSCGGGGGGVGCGSSTSSTLSAAGSDNENGSQPPPVTVTKQENVGPYETVQLHSTDGSALNAWLTTNGFDIPSDVQTVIDAYVGEGFDFLAMKLLPNEGIAAMRPVRVTTPGASMTLPLRMAAVGTGASVGISLWVIAVGRYEPQNFPFFHIEDKDLVWDWNASASNYTTLRAQNETTLLSRGWEIESSIDINEQTISNAILTGGKSVGATSSVSVTSNAEDDYLPIGTPPGDIPFDPGDAGDLGDGGDASDDGGGNALDAGGIDTDAGPYESADEVRADDIRTLLEPGNGSNYVRITRMRADLAHAAMSVDLVIQASSDQSELSNQRIVTESVNEPACPKCPDSGCSTTSVPPENREGLGVTVLAALGLLFTSIVRVRRRRKK